MQLAFFMFVLKLVIKAKIKMKTISTKIIQEQTVKLNKFALESTEKIVLKTISTTEDLQKKTSNVLKSTLIFSAKQQDKFFNNAEKAKNKIWKNINKSLNFFSKN